MRCIDGSSRLCRLRSPFWLGAQLALVSLIFRGSAQAEDLVTLRSDQPARESLTERGEIRDWTGESIVIARRSGTERTYAAGRILRVKTSWPEGYEAGKRLLADGEFAPAIRSLQAAERAEQRPWADRQIRHRLMLALQGNGQLDEACRMFLSLAEQDPATPAYRDAPLCWLSGQRLPPRAAESLVDDSSHAAGLLLGASHLLGTPSQSRAEQVLRQLLQAENPRIAALAEAQLWRPDWLGATEADAERWAERIEAMPEVVRGGPYFIVAQAWQQLGRVDEALLAYVRLPVSYPTQRGLAARALVSAARLSHSSGQPREAALLLREAANEYPERNERREAEQLLKNWSSSDNQDP